MTPLAELTAAQLMTREVRTVRAETSVRELAELLIRHEISGTVVLDGDGKPVGVVSVVDITRATAEGEGLAGTASLSSDFYVEEDDPWDDGDLDDLPIENRSLLVRDIMTPAIYAVDETSRLPEIARQMVENHLHRVLVLRDEKVAGIVSSTDVLRAIAERPAGP